MFGRKKRRIVFLEFENEMLRRQSEELKRYYNNIESGNIVKYLISHPECIGFGKAIINKQELDIQSQEVDIVRVENPGINHYTIRVVDKE